MLLSGLMIRVSIQKPITVNQLDSCAEILRSLPQWFGDAQAVTKYLNDLLTLDTYLAHRNSELVGFAALRQRSVGVAEIHVMGVARRERRRGVGRALLNQIVVDLLSNGVMLLVVQTLGPSEPCPAYAQTREFYEALGFLPLLEIQQHDWTDPTLIMVRPL